MERRRLDEIWARFVADGQADPTEQREAAAAMAGDEAHWSAALADAEMDGLLRRVLAPEDEGEAFVRQFESRVRAEQDGAGDALAAAIRRRAEQDGRGTRPRLGVWISAGAIVAAAAAIALVLGFPRRGEQANRQDGRPARTVPRVALAPSGTPSSPPAAPAEPPVATVARVQGTVFLLDGASREAAQAGASLPAGRGVITVGGQSAAQIVLAEGTEIGLGASTVVTAIDRPALAVGEGGARLFLAMGALRARVPARAPAPGGAALAVVTPHAEATVTAGQAALSVSARATKLEMIEGRARLVRAGGGGGSATEVGAGQEATVAEGGAAIALGPSPRANTATLVVFALPPTRGELLIKKRLEGLGYAVSLHTHYTVGDGDDRLGGLVVLSSTLESAEVNARFRNAPVPALVLEPYLFGDMGMTGRPHNEEAHTSHSETGLITIGDPSHPLAAGLSGTVRVVKTAVHLGWGVVSPFGAAVAAWAGKPQRSVVFGYERGSPLVGMVAPARRVGLFLEDGAIEHLTDEGWALFDAAARWCAADRQAP